MVKDDLKTVYLKAIKKPTADKASNRDVNNSLKGEKSSNIKVRNLIDRRINGCKGRSNLRMHQNLPHAPEGYIELQRDL